MQAWHPLLSGRWQTARLKISQRAYQDPRLGFSPRGQKGPWDDRAGLDSRDSSCMDDPSQHHCPILGNQKSFRSKLRDLAVPCRLWLFSYGYVWSERLRSSSQLAIVSVRARRLEGGGLSRFSSLSLVRLSTSTPAMVLIVISTEAMSVDPGPLR